MSETATDFRNWFFTMGAAALTPNDIEYLVEIIMGSIDEKSEFDEIDRKNTERIVRASLMSLDTLCHYFNKDKIDAVLEEIDRPFECGIEWVFDAITNGLDKLDPEFTDRDKGLFLGAFLATYNHGYQW